MPMLGNMSNSLILYQIGLQTSEMLKLEGGNISAIDERVYTVSDESTHLLISNVPAIKLSAELCNLCNRFGDLVICTQVPNYDNDKKFVETYHIQYLRIQCARFAKRQMDGRTFFGEVLHVCYAPELETLDETRSKLIQRRKEVTARIKKKQKVNENLEVSATKSFMPAKTMSKQYCQIEEWNENETTPRNDINNDHHPNQMVSSETVTDKDLMECCHWQTLNVDGKHLMNSDKVSKAVSSSTCSKTNKLSFVPRPLAVRKQIVYHKKSEKS